MKIEQPINIDFKNADGLARTFKGLIVEVAEREGLILRNTVAVSVTNRVEGVETTAEDNDTAIIMDKKCYFKKLEDTVWTVSFTDFRDVQND